MAGRKTKLLLLDVLAHKGHFHMLDVYVSSLVKVFSHYWLYGESIPLSIVSAGVMGSSEIVLPISFHLTFWSRKVLPLLPLPRWPRIGLLCSVPSPGSH